MLLSIHSLLPFIENMQILFLSGPKTPAPCRLLIFVAREKNCIHKQFISAMQQLTSNLSKKIYILYGVRHENEEHRELTNK